MKEAFVATLLGSGLFILLLCCINSGSVDGRKIHQIFVYRRHAQNDCQLLLYSRPSFQGKLTSVNKTKRHIRAKEKSVETRGECCWVAFRRRRFRGRPILFRSHTTLSNPHKWGWRGNRIRSVKKLNNC
uniref:Beta/gamma crystallin 'Greek key' domain-containing protein n=1 Tax=Lepeophtheirus salmonis TaxID=72036 RepID=A0A0K2TK16_LEPSM